MALGDDRRKIVFAVVVLALAGVGVYLSLRPAAGGDGRAEPAGVITTGPARPPAADPPAASPGSFDIYSYLPVTRAQIAEAADVARRFATSYATFRHDEDAASYAERLKGFTTAEFGAVLARDVTTPATVEHNRTEQIVSQGSAKLTAIRDIAAGSVTVVVTAVQDITDRNGTRRQTADYAVTLTQVGTGWRVFDLQPATTGQSGDTGGGAEGEGQ
ncbi:hypothetical protein Sru01_27100 [Sphaerisporangium rufum]|uniref:Uncharacterized protein n=1 Tax=Sphaerisporangium rufum TaxID=1381558 RepID=A0A919V1D0_9ACTN|nr:hypothetical protein [Sphaerisporangium rufum]GII77728.1 hypothetical protein Sru01_27100 [Sphaerisporangium rufum]